MVKTKAEQPIVVDDVVDLDLWLVRTGELRPELNLSRLRKVCELAEQAEEKAIASNSIWAEGHSSYRIGLQMAEILNELQVDEDGLVAAVIYRAVRENQLTLNHVRKQFGDQVAQLVEGALKMAAISEIQFGFRKKVLGERKDQLEQARRMLVSLVDDVRVALLKLAERTCAIRNAVRRPSPKSLRLAREVSKIYAPLAHRLGIGHLKWELEDLSFRLLEPVAYKRTAEFLDEKRTDRQEYIADVMARIEREMRAKGIEARVTGRPKHIYSIWRKMRRKGIPFSAVYDVRAVRILVNHVEDCYKVLGAVHDLWPNIRQEFNDYIANPKGNGYQSLHTAVVGPERKVLEIQIRTEEMHKEAEFGVCSHWQYKVPDDDKESPQYRQRLDWLRQLLEGHEDYQELAGLDLIGDMSNDRVYVFTPDGDVVDMTQGATPLDFAYRVHTEIGHKCRGAKVNGRVVPLNTRLNPGDRVEVIVGDEAEPRREWLHKHLGYVSTARARGKILSWFSKRGRQKNIDEGERILREKLAYLGAEGIDFSLLAERVKSKSTDQLFYDFAVGAMSIGYLIENAAALIDFDASQSQLNLGMEDGMEGGMGDGKEGEREDETLFSGQGGLECEVAGCCQPVPGDPVVGVIGDGNMVSVHRQDCLQALLGDAFGNKIKLKWRALARQTFPVYVEVLAYDRSGLLHDITGVFMEDEINVQAINMLGDRKSNKIMLKMIIEVPRLSALLQILEKIQQLPNVISARRAAMHA